MRNLVEPVERRLCLAATLSLGPLPEVVRPGVPVSVRVTLAAGDVRVRGPVTLRLVASSDGSLDASDPAAAKAMVWRVDVRPGRSVTRVLRATFPDALPGGATTLFAVAGPPAVTGQAAVLSDAGSVATATTMLSRSFAAGAPITVIDRDGSRVVFTLSGPGSGFVAKRDAGLAVSLSGTTPTTRLSVRASDGLNGVADLDSLSAEGAVGAIRAPDATLTRLFSAGGPVGSLSLGRAGDDLLLRVPTTLGSLVVGGRKVTVEGNPRIVPTPPDAPTLTGGFTLNPFFGPYFPSTRNPGDPALLGDVPGFTGQVVSAAGPIDSLSVSIGGRPPIDLLPNGPQDGSVAVSISPAQVRAALGGTVADGTYALHFSFSALGVRRTLAPAFTLDSTAPTLLSLTPATARLTRGTNLITVRFSEAVLIVNGELARVTPPGGSVIFPDPVEPTPNNRGATINLLIEDTRPPGTFRLVIRAAAVSDPAGNPLPADLVYDFDYAG